jgi:alkanesulfonate monooxygenase SsuD/methylene tetrahydromethanopterin reductase-like flavin-dependent oxidoreductase (luciferase family)
VPFPPVAERFERLVETRLIVRQMWGPDDGPFKGRHYQLAETVNSPQPLTRPHPPIMIGGGGEKKTLRLVAKYADACNLFTGSQTGPEQIKAKLDILARHCEREGTDYARIRKTVTWNDTITPDAAGGAALAAKLAPLAALGVSAVHIMPGLAEPVEFLRNVGEHVVGPVHAL